MRQLASDTALGSAEQFHIDSVTLDPVVFQGHHQATVAGRMAAVHVGGTSPGRYMARPCRPSPLGVLAMYLLDPRSGRWHRDLELPESGAGPRPRVFGDPPEPAPIAALPGGPGQSPAFLRVSDITICDPAPGWTTRTGPSHPSGLGAFGGWIVATLVARANRPRWPLRPFCRLQCALPPVYS